MEIPLATLLVTQEQLRHVSQLPDMICHIREGNFWTSDYLSTYAQSLGVKPSPLIQLSLFEDGKLFIHDGHHRSVATWLAGRVCLRKDEYVVKKWTYKDYLEINPLSGWYTPFDPRKEVRLGDFSEFKNEAKSISPRDGARELSDFVFANKHHYCEPRTLWTVADLATQVISDNSWLKEIVNWLQREYDAKPKPVGVLE